MNIESKILGKQIVYPQRYTPEILVSVPRKLNRETISIDNNNLPFTGFDVWHAYEFSFLTNSGLPVVGILKIIIPAESSFLVESKSLKIYLNSFNMERYGNNSAEGISILLEIIKKDISNLLQCDVLLSYFDPQSEVSPFDFSDYLILENEVGNENIVFTNYNETHELLISGMGKSGEIKFGTHLLRSNCRITHQPDWGSAYIYLKSEYTPTKEGLLKYLVSMRNENHFHEEICEMIYQRLKFYFAPEELMVACIYTRRGGIDICPVRVSSSNLLPEYLCNCNMLSYKLLRQ